MISRRGLSLYNSYRKIFHHFLAYSYHRVAEVVQSSQNQQFIKLPYDVIIGQSRGNSHR